MSYSKTIRETPTKTTSHSFGRSGVAKTKPRITQIAPITIMAIFVSTAPFSSFRMRRKAEAVLAGIYSVWRYRQTEIPAARVVLSISWLSDGTHTILRRSLCLMHKQNEFCREFETNTAASHRTAILVANGSNSIPPTLQLGRIID